jgi:hypothetical protein
MKVFSRVLTAMVLAIAAAVASLFVSTGTSHAGLDNELSLVDGQDRTLTIQQWDTFLNGVFPLDRNRLTREWFHSGRAKFIVAGPGADEFEGTLELGYQIGFPWSLGVGINFSYTTPNILLDDASIFPNLGTADNPVVGLGFAPWVRSSRRTCSPACRSAPTSVTAPASRKSPPSRWTSLVRPAVSRCRTLTAR